MSLRLAHARLSKPQCDIWVPLSDSLVRYRRARCIYLNKSFKDVRCPHHTPYERPRAPQLPLRSTNRTHSARRYHAVTKGVTTALGAQPRTPQRAGVLLTRRTRVARLLERPGRTPTRQRDDTAHFTHRRHHAAITPDRQHNTAQRARGHISHARSGRTATSRTQGAQAPRKTL